MIFDPITINNVTFANRLLLSSVGGRAARITKNGIRCLEEFREALRPGRCGRDHIDDAQHQPLPPIAHAVPAHLRRSIRAAASEIHPRDPGNRRQVI